MRQKRYKNIKKGYALVITAQNTNVSIHELLCGDGEILNLSTGLPVASYDEYTQILCIY